MFLMGYYCRQAGCIQRIKQLPLFASLTIIFSCLAALFVLNPPTSVLFYQNNSYFTQPIDIYSGALIRTAWHLVTCVLSIAVLSILLKVKSERLARYGKASLLFYVCHVLILYFVRILLQHFGMVEYPALSIVCFVIVTFTLCLVSQSKYCKFITNPFSNLWAKA